MPQVRKQVGPLDVGQQQLAWRWQRGVECVVCDVCAAEKQASIATGGPSVRSNVFTSLFLEISKDGMGVSNSQARKFLQCAFPPPSPSPGRQP